MNGRAARRIRRAAWQTVQGLTRVPEKRRDLYLPTLKRLKREYKTLPYHRRRSEMYQILTHREQERRYCRKEHP